MDFLDSRDAPAGKLSTPAVRLRVAIRSPALDMSALIGRKTRGAAVAAGWSLALVLLQTGGIGVTRATNADASTPEELVYALQYIGTDYGVAVRDGRVLDSAEYDEVLGLSDRSVGMYSSLRPQGSAARDLDRLRGLIRSRSGWAPVRSLSQDLVRRLTDELDVVPYPAATPNLEAGRELYRVNCAPCHGPVGGGDGPSSGGMTPKPTSFRGPATSLLSPHHVVNAARFGVPGTAMPAWGDGLPAQDLWDVAFFVMTMRDGFEPNPPVEVVPLSLSEIASLSDEELLHRLRVSRPGASISELDFYRAGFLRAAPAVDRGGSAPGEDGLGVAESLERAFGKAAEKVFPSVVGISVYDRDVATASGRDAEPSAAGWRAGGADERIYPGFHVVRSGSGFIVSGDGDILTSAELLAGEGLAANDRVVDVELPGNVHCRSRLVGREPTIDLAVLKIASPVPVRPAMIGDSDDVRVGQWAIAVGDPPGAERIFSPGTIAARPERECYQEHRTSTLLQASMVIDPAGFGGPLVSIHGLVVGLTTSGHSVVAPSIGICNRTVTALPINLAMTIYRALKVKESELSPWLGFSVLELNAGLRTRLRSAPPTGIYIDDVFEPSPASRAGVLVGDVLTRMDDHPILGVSDFQTWLYLLGIDATVTLEIVRDGKPLRKRIRIEQRPAAASTK
jgi:serine protease Do